MDFPPLPQTNLSLFSGAGGLDLGLHVAVPGLRTVCYVEREAYACAVLAARMDEERLAPGPIWTDVTTFDGRPWRGVVDLVSGGSPCQDLSLAGKRAGLGGERSGLFYQFTRVVDEVRPRWVFWENVAGAKSVLPVVCAEFERLGYRGAWTSVRASDVGAPHDRERVFLLAYSDRGGREGLGGMGVLDGERAAQRNDPDRCGNSYPPCRGDVDGWARYSGPLPYVYRSPSRLGAGMDLSVRCDRLRLTGNGVVPDQAAYAWAVLHDFLRTRHLTF